jgi:ATP-dependent exoDNAse (exonuclease V) beta subunit
MQASAGSGKTYNLTKRYLRLLIGSCCSASIKNVVAMTFTNKAAIEMKRRIINYLKKAVLFLNIDGFFDDLGLTKSEIAEKSSFILRNIFESYDDFNIGTIDSFKNHILKSCAINIDISPNFTIEQDYSKNLLFALEAFLQKVQLFKSLSDITVRYLTQYLMEDLSWFPKNNIYNEIRKVFERSGNVGKDIVLSEELNFGEKLLFKAKKIIYKVEQFSNYLSKIKINFHYNEAVEKVLEEGIKVFFSMQIPSVFAYKILKYRKGATANVVADELWREINKDIKSFCTFYMENYYGVYSDIYSKVVLEFNKQSKKEGIIFLNEINKKTVDFFEKNDALMPEVYYRLSEKYKHFLIDEFQDTSFVQWVGIKRFLEESLATGGTFFYVGDVKQAIYFFRGGSAEIFNNVEKEFNFLNVDKKYLTQNFRSGKIIVDFNNSIFSKKNIKRFLEEVYKDKNIEHDFSKFTEAYSFSRQMPPKENHYGYVEICTIDKTLQNIKEKIKQEFIKCIFQVLKRFELEDIAVLCRTKEEIFIVSSWLLENELEVESLQTLNIKNNDFIKQIVSLLMFINSPVDALSFSSFVIGDIFSKVTNIDKSVFEQFIFIFREKNKTGTLYKIFKCKYERLWDDFFEIFFVKAGFISVYELILAIICKFRITNNFPNSKVFVMCFLELVKNFEKQDSGLRNFLYYLNSLSDDDDSLFIKSTLGNGIKAMTVHKAKGLQFPVVIIPFLKLSERAVDKLHFDDSGEKIKLLNISKTIAKFSQKAKKLYTKAKSDSLLSELNILYVSMTRAKYEFYALVPPKCGTSNNLIPILFGDNNFIQGSTMRVIDRKIDRKDMIISDTFIGDGYRDIQKYFKSASKIRLDVTKSENNGIIVHYALSKITSLRNRDIDSTVNQAVKFTERKFFSENVEFVREKINKLFNSKKILKLFMYDENSIHNEKEIMNASGETFRIDKLIISNDEIIVVDFKSSEWNEGINKKQVQNYLAFVSEIYPKKKPVAYIVNVEKDYIIAV